ncbi:MAG: cation:proton antiporter [Rhodospirillaceae bacterium]|nr:cation:proton antiporter [Rhodospirillaceae bacterium]
MTADQLVGYAPFLPFVGAGVIWLAGPRPNVREACTLITAGLLFIMVAAILPTVMDGGRPGVTLFDVVPGISIAFEVEPLGMLFAMIAAFLWIPNSIYSIGYMRAHHEENQTRYYACFALALGSAIGVAFAANMFTLFLFYEVLSVCTYPLVTHAGTPEAKRSGRIYLGILLGTSIGFQLLAILWTYVLAGTLDFRPEGLLAGRASEAVIAILFALYIFGIGKAALMPFHRWLPAAMVAPTPVSALLHAVAVVKAGVFTVMKVVVYVFGLDLMQTANPGTWLPWLASFTILTASFIALTKDNLKARLAYSTVSQLSYIVLGASLATSWSIVGGGMHILMHAFGKITLFFCAGAIMVTAHKTEISDMTGIGRTMPLTMFAFLLGALSVIGLPPMGGTWSKWYLAMGAMQADQIVFVVVLLISSLLNIAYFMPIVVNAFFVDRGGSHAHTGIKEAPLACLIPLLITAIGSLLLFLFPDPAYQLLLQIVEPLTVP